MANYILSLVLARSSRLVIWSSMGARVARFFALALSWAPCQSFNRDTLKHARQFKRYVLYRCGGLT